MQFRRDLKTFLSVQLKRSICIIAFFNIMRCINVHLLIYLLKTWKDVVNEDINDLHLKPSITIAVVCSRDMDVESDTDGQKKIRSL